ncbi:MAG: isopentenyl-diphosphate Delta-isomerase [Woeseiaceae bacterium]
MSQESAKIVSSEDELLILVDEHDNQSGMMSKAACHDGDGTLHRAFSIFLFNSEGKLLLQQRASGKRLWPQFWSNSCCSHPRQGEAIEFAASRRLSDELHASADLEFVYRFIYQASFGELGSEHEMCHVFLGSLVDEPHANETEIEALRYVSAEELGRELEAQPESFTPWFKLEWERLNAEFSDTLARYTNPD